MRSNTPIFLDQIVVVTGGNRGIGRAISRLFLSEGARLVVIGRAERSAELQDSVTYIQADLASVSGRHSACAAIGAMERLDVLVNNAGIFGHGSFTDDDAKAELLAVTMCAPMILARAALPLLRRTKGSIINISSLNAIRPRPGAEAYSAAKAALETMTRALAIEVGEMGIRVNAVAPGPVPTDLLANAIGGEDPLFMLPHIPLGRLGTPEDIAHAVGFLASAAAGWITGQVLRVDGGMSVT